MSGCSECLLADFQEEVMTKENGLILSGRFKVILPMFRLQRTEINITLSSFRISHLLIS